MSIGTTLKSLGTQILSHAFGVESNTPEPITYDDGTILFQENPFDPNDKVIIVTGVSKTVRHHKDSLLEETIGFELTQEELDSYKNNPEQFDAFLEGWDMSDKLRNDLHEFRDDFFARAETVFKTGIDSSPLKKENFMKRHGPQAGTEVLHTELNG